MIYKADGAIKSIMNKNVNTKKLNFRTKIMIKTNCFSSARNYYC